LLHEFATIRKVSARAQLTVDAGTGLNPYTRRSNIALHATTGGDDHTVLSEQMSADFTSHTDVVGLDVAEHYPAISNVYATAEGYGALHPTAHFKVAVALDVANHDRAWT